MRNQSYRADFLTRRIPKTQIKASASYSVQDTSANTNDAFYIMMGNQNTLRRTVLYNADIGHAPTQELRFNLGASRNNESASQTYTLSTLQPSTTTVTSTIDIIYFTANYSTFLTRSLNYNAELREERSTVQHHDIEAHQISQYLNYRVRSILMSLEHKWRQDNPENGPSTTQQMTFFRISRPF